MVDKTDSVVVSFESRFARWVVARRWFVIIASLILVGVAAFGATFLTLSTNYRVFFDHEDPHLQAFESLEETYGKNQDVLFVMEPGDGNALSEHALSATIWLTERAWQTPYSTRVDSISNFSHTTTEDDELHVDDLVTPDVLENPDELSRIREIALTEPRLIGRLLSQDGSVSATLVTVSLPDEDRLAGISEVTEFARNLAAEVENAFDGIDIRVVGTVLIDHEFTVAAVSGQTTALILSLSIMSLILAVLTRRIGYVIATGIVMLLSVAVSMGLGGAVGLTFSSSTAPAPTMVLMIAVANCVHILVTTQQRLTAGDTVFAAVEESLRVNLRPVFLASVTTAIGFMALNFSEVPPHRHLGTFVSFGIMASFFLSVTFLPALLCLLSGRSSSSTRNQELLMTMIGNFVIKHRRMLLIGCTAVVLAFATLIPRNELNDVLPEYFGEDLEFRQDLNFLDERISGNTILQYSLVSPDGIADPKFLSDASAFAEWFRSQPNIRNVSIITDTLRQINKTMHDDDPNAYQLPETRELAAQYLLLYEFSVPFGLDLNNQISSDNASTRMVVTARTLSSRDVLSLNRRAIQWLEENGPSIAQADGTGIAMLFAYIGQRNSESMLVGTIVVLLTISIILLLTFRSILLGLVSLVPNFVPAILGFGIWGLFDGQIGTILTVVVAMTIGIVVDDTVHFLSKYRRARTELGQDPEQSIIYAFQTVGRSIFTTTMVLVAGFLILLMSDFVPTAQVGLLTAIIVAAAMVFDFLLLPPLLIVSERFTRAQPSDAVSDQQSI